MIYLPELNEWISKNILLVNLYYGLYEAALHTGIMQSTNPFFEFYSMEIKTDEEKTIHKL